MQQSNKKSNKNKRNQSICYYWTDEWHWRKKNACRTRRYYVWWMGCKYLLCLCQKEGISWNCALPHQWPLKQREKKVNSITRNNNNNSCQMNACDTCHHDYCFWVLFSCFLPYTQTKGNRLPVTRNNLLAFHCATKKNYASNQKAFHGQGKFVS